MDPRVSREGLGVTIEGGKRNKSVVTVAAGRRHSVLCFSHDVICKVKNIFIVILIPKCDVEYIK